MTRHRPSTRISLSAAARRAAEREKALAACQQGQHQTMPTFRPGERICLLCGVVFYCPLCFSENNLLVAQVQRVYPFECPIYQKVEVQQP